MTRAEIVTFLWRPAGRPAAPSVDPGCTFTAIGDSVMLGAVLHDDLGPARFPGWTGVVDVSVCRLAVVDLRDDACGVATIPSALSAIEAADGAGTLGGVVSVHVGTNDPTFPASGFDRLVEAAEEIYFVNLATRNPWEAHVNGVIRDGVARWRGRRMIGLLDWHDSTAHSPGLLDTDGTHLSAPAGARAFNRLIAGALDG